MADKDFKDIVDAEQLRQLPPEQQQAALQVFMNQVTGLDGAPRLTEEQVSEVIAQRRLTYDYVRADRQDEHERYKISAATVRVVWISGLAAGVKLGCWGKKPVVTVRANSRPSTTNKLLATFRAGELRIASKRLFHISSIPY